MSDSFERERHIKFLLACIKMLPTQYSNLDSNRLTLSYFVIAGLDLLGEIDRVDKQSIISYVYSLQILPGSDNPEKNSFNCGFRGSPFFGYPFNSSKLPSSVSIHDQGHIAMTYTALLILRILGDDFSRVNKQAVVHAIRHLQQHDGSISCVPGGSESDMRFIYCASAISFMLNDWNGIDVDKTVKYIISSQSFDAGIGQGPGQESHGGSTYCAVASLHLMGRLHELPKRDALIRWCLERQITGFQGRINKDPDTCYSFWIGASLHLLGFHSLTDYSSIRGFALNCQAQKIGGFSKWPNYHPDVLHTYFAMCGLSLGGEEGLARIDCGLGLTERASANWLDNRRVKQVELHSMAV